MQKRKHSLLETAVNTTAGYLIAILTQVIVYPLFAIHTTLAQDSSIAAIFTIVSFIRGYFVRRLFNYFQQLAYCSKEDRASWGFPPVKFWGKD